MTRPEGFSPRLLVMGMVLGVLAACAGNDPVREKESAKGPVTGQGSAVQTPEAPPPPPEVAVPLPAVVSVPASAAEAGADKALLREAAVANFRGREFRMIAPQGWSSRAEEPQDRENYESLQGNPVHRVSEQPVSTFSIDVDTGSYANVRRFLNAGQLPPQDAVRVEEMLNYFDYDYPVPSSRDRPFQVSTALAQTPWNPESQLLRIGIRGYEVPASQRPASNLVFLIDVSGSMQSPDKLPLLKNAFRLLTQQLSAADKVSLVVYAGATGVVLEPTAGDRKQTILGKLAELEAGGSTNGGAGIDLAYRKAREGFIKGGINRVILATDGDFNVGTVSFEALVDKVERERASGVALTTLGFGTGNYNEKLLERLADAGNGNYSYVDTLPEARKVLVEELSSTLFTIARDVKIQVEFNPAVVAEYRLIGYENRLLAREDFNNDKVDAGDIGAGHRVTALYEVIPVGKRGFNEPLRYEGNAEKKSVAPSAAGELAFVRLRYKAPDSSAGDNASKLIEFPVHARSLLMSGKESTDFRFAASVAAFGQKLRGGKYIGEFGYADIRALAKPAAGNDKQGYRREFLALLDLAETLEPRTDPATGGERVGSLGADPGHE